MSKRITIRIAERYHIVQKQVFDKNEAHNITAGLTAFCYKGKLIWAKCLEDIEVTEPSPYSAPSGHSVSRLYSAAITYHGCYKE